MILTLAGALIFSVLIVWFVLSPLFSAQNMEMFASSYKGFADETELRQVLVLRDQLIERLVRGTTGEQRVAELSESESFDALISLCLRLQRADLPYLPVATAAASAEVKPSERGTARAGFLVIISLLAFLLIFFIRVPISFAQPMAPQNPHGGSSAHSGAALAQVPVESLHILEPGALLPTSNRYVISPAQAQILVHHVSGFSVPGNYTPSTKIVMAVPEDVYDWQIVEIKPDALAKQVSVSQWNGMPAVQLPAGTEGLVVSLTSQYVVRGTLGRVQWRNRKLSSFPGEQVAVLFQIQGILRNVFGSAADDWNIWPPRLSRAGQGVELSDREIRMSSNNPPRKVQIVSRQPNVAAAPFFNFEVIGLVPSRTPLILLGALVGAVLFGVALTVFARRTRWRIDAPESLPR
jgi:hypothetical protein